jgi:hypothetical protein
MHRPAVLPNLHLMRILLPSLLLLGSVNAASARPPAAAPAWDNLKSVPITTKLHVSADHMSKTCRLVSVDDEKLVCARGKNFTFLRENVKSVKRTRYLASTAAGLGIGIGAGAAIGFAVFHSTPNDFFGNLGPDIGRGFSIALGGIAGPAILGPTDAFRGPTLYRRP